MPEISRFLGIVIAMYYKEIQSMFLSGSIYIVSNLWKTGFWRRREGRYSISSRWNDI